jgi:hypothetical protein
VFLYVQYTYPFYQVCHLYVYPELLWSIASQYSSKGFLYLGLCILTELMSPIPCCISYSDVSQGYCSSLLSAASAVMGYDLWLVMIRCCVHTHLLTYLLIYLLPSLLSPIGRFVVNSGIGFCWLPFLHGHPRPLRCLLRDNITMTKLMRLRSGPVTNPLLLSSSGILLKLNPLPIPKATRIGYSWLRLGYYLIVPRGDGWGSGVGVA